LEYSNETRIFFSISGNGQKQVILSIEITPAKSKKELNMLIKGFLVLLIIIASSNYLLALRANTVGSNFACFSESDFDDLVSFAAAKDKASIQAYIDQKRCFVLREGLQVTILKSPGMFGGRAQCAYKGVKFWTFREALEDWH
jgi:hypothetical protein